MVKDETFPLRVDLTGSQRAQLDERLRRARQSTGAAKSSEPRLSIPRRGGGEEIPLSFAQERLWFLDQLEPGSPVYNVCQAMKLSGVLDVSALEKALNEIVRRHEILRTNFLASEGHAIQAIAPARTLSLAVADLGALPGTEADAEQQRRLLEESRRPFDLARDLLVRAVLIRRSSTEHVLMLTMHHIISDGWSVGILFRELAALYTGALAGSMAPVDDLPIQFADYVLWERDAMQSAAIDKLLAYWKKQLAGPLPVLELPFDHPRASAPGSRGAAQWVQLAPALSQALKTLSQKENASLFMTLMAALQVLLYRWTGQEDIVVGSVVAGRRRVELESLIGFFVNTLVFRGDLAGSPSFREYLARVRETTFGVMAHQDMPFERLVKELRPDRAPSRNPLFQVMFVLQNAPMAPAELPQLRLEPLEIDNGTAKFDLTLSMTETPAGLRAALEYNADLFEPATISRLLGCFQTLLESIVAQPDQSISRLPLLTASERHQLVTAWNQTWSDYPRDQTIPALFAQQVARDPAAIALTFNGAAFNYGELDARSNQLAHRLAQLGVQRGTLVGVSMQRSLEQIVAILGILKAGGVYVSLDPAYPKERLAFMLEDIQAPVLITQDGLRATVEQFLPRDTRGPELLCLDPGCGAIAAESPAPLICETTADDLAYISYTSGSTGKPKGVCVPHRGVVRLVKNTDYARFDTDEVFLQFAPIAFDASTLEIWGALLNGARLVIFPPGPASLTEIGETIEKNGVTTLWLTAGLFHQMIEEQVGKLQNVRQLLAGGDVLSAVHVTRAFEQLPRTQLINGYGPTENTTFTCCHRIMLTPAAGRSIPIGRPIANTQIYVLDREMQPAPIGVPGELYTGGDGLARGYLNRDALTQEKFVPHPFSAVPGARLYRTGDLARWLPDGTVEFLGRIDRQVKIRGFRVEPGEVESILATHPAVRECVVAVRDDATGGKSLVAYLVPQAAPAPTAETWRAFLEEKIPSYLMPSAFVAVDAIPLNTNGKIDLNALPVSDGTRPELQHNYIAPRDETEKRIVEIWESVLGVRPVGVYDRFFDLGGHSLLAVRVVAQLEKKFGKKLPVAAIFQHPTIEQLARLLRANEPRYVPATSIVEIQGHGTRQPMYLVHGVGGGMFWGYSNLARHLGSDQPVYAFKSRGLDGLPEWGTIEEMAANYLADLRAHQPRGPYLLGGYCFGGVVAYEMARQLQAEGETVSLLALVNCCPPNAGYEKTGDRRSLKWQAKFVRNLLYLLGCFLFSWTWRERTEFVRWKLRLVRRKSGGPLGQEKEIALTDVDEMVNLADYSEKQRSVWASHVRALMAYHPQPYQGRVTLFRTRGDPLLCSFDDQYGWGKLAQDGVDTRVMPGGHGNILDEPHVRAVAQALRGSLKAIDARQETSA